jgi:hypothetical protein
MAHVEKSEPEEPVSTRDSFALAAGFGSAWGKANLGCGLTTAILGILALAAVIPLLGGSLVGPTILSIVGLFLLWIAVDSFRTWISERKKIDQGPTVGGHGIRISPDGVVEVGLYSAKIDSEESLKTGRSVAYKSATWKRQYVCSGKLDVLLNIMRTEQRGWMIANFVVSSEGNRLQKDFINVRVDTRSTLWIARQGWNCWLSPHSVSTQFETLSSVLGLLKPPGSPNRLRLTFTESGSSSGGLVQVASANMQQNTLNQRLANGLLPADTPVSDNLVKRFGYEICPNEDAKAFRKW